MINQEVSSADPGYNVYMAEIMERAEGMHHLRLHGYTLGEISVIYRLTRERVRQILAKYFNLAAVPLMPKEVKIRLCANDGCNNVLDTKRKFCSGRCVALSHDAISSAYIFETLVCAGCEIEFERSRRIIVITKSLGCKKTYCTRECYQLHGPKSAVAMVKLICDHCECEFERRLANVNQMREGASTYCTRTCHLAARRLASGSGIVTLMCAHCKCGFDRLLSRVTPGPAYCTSACHGASRSTKC
jgi:hypothetical protein